MYIRGFAAAAIVLFVLFCAVVRAAPPFDGGAASLPPPRVSASPARGPVTPSFSDVVKPPASLVVDGVPPIPGALAEGIRPYTEFRGAVAFSFHPERVELLIGTRFADTVQLHRVLSAGGARTQLTFFPDRVAAAAWPRAAEVERLAGGPFLVLSRDRGGSENFQTYRLDPESGQVALLTDGKSRNSLGMFSRRGSRLAYTSTRRTGADTDIYVLDSSAASAETATETKTKTDRLVATVDGGGWSVLDWSADDRSLLVRQMISVNESFLWLVDVETGARTALTPRADGEQVAYGAAELTPDGKAAFVTTDRGSEHFRLARLELGSGRHLFLSDHVPWDIEELDVTADGRTVAVVANENGSGRLRLYDARSGKERRAPLLPPGSVAGVAWHANSRHLAVTLGSARMAADVFVADTRPGGGVQRWTASELGGVDLRALPEPEPIAWKSFDGRVITGWLYRPPPQFAGPRPVIVNIHGGPEAQARPVFQGRSNYLLTELGVAILYPNVRGSTGYGKTFTKLDNGLLREDAVKDVGALLDWIRTRADLDAERVMVSGGSYGGYMSLAVSARYADRIRCAIDVVGISNFVTFLERTEAYRRDLRRVEYGDERDPSTRAFLERISPLSNAAKIVKPILVAQGQNDPRVPLHEAEQIVATLKRRGTPVWSIVAKDEGHGFAKKHNADFLFYAQVAFIKTYLLGPQN